MKTLTTFIKGILAGLSIALGGTVFLALDHKVIGSLFFTVGLFVIVTRGYNLFTGKVCYSLDQPLSYVGDLGVMWVGNLLGTWLFALGLKATRLAPAMVEKAQAMCEVKLGDNLSSIFILAIFCNILIFVAVDSFKNNPHELGKYLALFFGVCVFILSGFEHCVANMFYFSVAGMWSTQALIFILVNTLGNALGGLLIPAFTKLFAEK
ncbi:MAG: formate/nitrite transporter family protein [Eubacteriales bacterium]|nr:formate/nitrite transporter family protein [Eubacteriales bacterium]